MSKRTQKKTSATNSAANIAPAAPQQPMASSSNQQQAPAAAAGRNGGPNGQGKQRQANKSIVQGKKKAKNAAINIFDYDTKNVIRDYLVPSETNDGGRVITYHSANIWYSLRDDTYSEVQIELPRLYCYGISAYPDAKKNSTTFSCTFVLGDREGPTEQTHLMLGKFDGMGVVFNQILEENKEMLNLYKDEDLARKKVLYAPMYKWKTERGQTVGSPTLKVKLWTSQFDTNGNRTPDQRIISTFYDGLSVEKNGDYRVMDFGELYDAEAQRQTPFYARATIAIRSAFVGAAILNYRVILKEAVVFTVKHTYQRLMNRPKPDDLEFAAKLREENEAAASVAAAASSGQTNATPSGELKREDYEQLPSDDSDQD